MVAANEDFCDMPFELILRPDWMTFAIGSFVSLFSISNPLIAAPIFVSLTADLDSDKKQALAFQAALNVCLILLIFFLLGSFILSLFGISINALRIAGGLMILTSAFNMLNKKERLLPEEKAEAQDRSEIAFSPLAMPLMSGPGAIAVIIGMTADASNVLDYMIIIGIIVTVAFLCYVVLWLADPIIRRCGKTLVKSFIRIMGFILLCVGVQMIASGVQAFLQVALKAVLPAA